jgi:chromosome segregation ATPase
MDFYSTLQRANAKDEKSLQSEGTDALRQEHGKLLALHSQLQTQASKLQAHNASLKESHETLKEVHSALQKHNTALQLQNSKLQEKAKLDAQLHSEQVRTLQSKDSALTERCKSLAASAELHRLANLKLEQKHTELHSELKANATELKANASQLKANATELKAKAAELQSMAALQAKTEAAHAALLQSSGEAQHKRSSGEAQLSKRLEAATDKLQTATGKLQAAAALLKSRPQLAQEGVSVLKSSAEVMRLAHAEGGVDSMRECLGQVCAVLDDLHGDLATHTRLASDWGRSLDKLLG